MLKWDFLFKTDVWMIWLMRVWGFARCSRNEFIWKVQNFRSCKFIMKTLNLQISRGQQQAFNMSVPLQTYPTNYPLNKSPANIAFKNQFSFHKKMIIKSPLSIKKLPNINLFDSKMMITAVSVALQRKYKSKIFWYK